MSNVPIIAGELLCITAPKDSMTFSVADLVFHIPLDGVQNPTKNYTT